MAGGVGKDTLDDEVGVDQVVEPIDLLRAEDTEILRAAVIEYSVVSVLQLNLFDVEMAAEVENEEFVVYAL